MNDAGDPPKDSSGPYVLAAGRSTIDDYVRRPLPSRDRSVSLYYGFNPAPGARSDRKGAPAGPSASPRRVVGCTRDSVFLRIIYRGGDATTSCSAPYRPPASRSPARCGRRCARCGAL